MKTNGSDANVKQIGQMDYNGQENCHLNEKKKNSTSSKRTVVSKGNLMVYLQDKRSVEGKMCQMTRKNVFNITNLNEEHV